MNIEVTNCNDERLIKYIKKSLKFYGDKLISKSMLKYISIEVEFDSTLKDMGGVTVEGYNRAKKARSFLIEVHTNLGVRSILHTLAHEMVHIKQFAYGEMTEKLNTWHGKYVNCNKVDYYDLPWEIEAYGKEQGLFNNFVTKEKLWKVVENIGIPDRPPNKEKMGWKK
jgi:hypothetical protein